ncbi:hypothetical protein [Acinetobacter sp. ANC 4633]|nr:hypothetical protein [Acinetobacter sp. ANC 4633]
MTQNIGRTVTAVVLHKNQGRPVSQWFDTAEYLHFHRMGFPVKPT